MSLLDELNPACPRGCGRTMDDCHESEDGGECEGGELLHENEKLKAERDEVRAHYERVLGESQRKESALEEAIRDKDVADQKLGHIETAIERLTAELAESKRRECTALCTDIERDRDQLNIALAEAKRQRDIAERELFDANRKLGNLRGVRIWTNEDDKKFAFADDLAVALEWTVPSQAVVSEAVAHAVNVGTQLAEIETRVAADKAVLEAADRLAELTNHWPHIDDDTEEQGYNDWNTALEALQEAVKERKAISAGPGLSGTGPLATPTESSPALSNVESESKADGPEQTDDTTDKITVSERWACGCWIDYAAQKEFMCDQHKRHCLYETGCSNITEYGTVFCDRHRASSVSAQAEAGGNG